MNRLLASLHSDERGQIALTIILTFLAGFIVAALALDAGIWYFDHRAAQNQVDSAAQAAVLELPSSDAANAKAVAEQYLALNGVDTSLGAPIIFTGSIPRGDQDPCKGMNSGEGRIAFGQRDDDGRYWTVRVCLRRDSLVLLSHLAGVVGSTISAGGTAHVDQIPVPYSLMSMRETSQNNCQTLQITGQANVNIIGGGGTYTAATCSSALNVNNNATLNSGENDIANGGTGSGTSWQNVAPVQDPFGYLTQPPSPGFGSCRPIPGNQQLTPGTYCDQLRIGPGDSFTMAAGIYIFTDGIDMSGGSLTSNGSEVLLYGSCGKNSPRNCTSSDAVTFKFSGGTVNLKGLRSQPDLGQLLFWIDRDSKANNNCLQLAAGSDWVLDGNTYAYSCDVQVSGQSGVTLTLNMAIVAGSIQLSGQATFNIPYDPILAPKILLPALVD